MAGRTTSIEWTESTWNPTVGCSLMSPGCTNCYAMLMARRVQGSKKRDKAYNGVTKKSKGGPVWTGVVNVSEKALLKPLSWRKPRLVFVNSMSDLFHESLTDWDIARVWAVMAIAHRHTYQVLTKRPERMADWLRDRNTPALVGNAMQTIRSGCSLPAWPLENVWCGTSVEDQKRADERIPALTTVPAAVRFLSLEPLLGAVSLVEAVQGDLAALRKIHWAIVGGESGPKARPMHPAWARALRDEAAALDIAFFFKQVGSWAWVPDAKAREWLSLDGKRVSEHPRGTGWQGILRGSKKAGGRKLDGRIHEAQPTVGVTSPRPREARHATRFELHHAHRLT